MRLRPETLAMTAVLAMLTALGPLSTDFYLPSLPDIGVRLAADDASVQLTLSLFLVGFAVGQLIYGPLSDKYGRRPVLLVALCVFVAASAVCAAAPSIEGLIIARFLQAVGASGPIVLARAIVRDLYAGPRAGQELARMGTIMGLVPAVAPILGGFLHEAFGWRAAFVATLLFGVLLFATIATALPETLKTPNLAPVSPASILRSFREFLRNGRYVAFLLLFACAYAGLFAFISGSSFVLQRFYGLGPVGFGLSFGAGVLGYITGTLIGARLVARSGIDRTTGVGAALLAGGGLMMVVAVLAGIAHPAAIVVPMALYAGGVGVVMPTAIAGALTPFPDRAGAASSLLGFVQMTFAAIVGIGVGHAVGDSALPLAVTIAVLGCGAGLVWLMTRRMRATHP